MRGRFCFIIGLLCISQSLHAQVRGWLSYRDGNVLSGELLQTSLDGGIFRSDRFGQMPFLSSEAEFKADPEAGPQDAEPPTPVVWPMLSDWVPARWTLTLSGYWENDGGSRESDFAVDLDATWMREKDEVHLALYTDYKVSDNEVSNNEQSGRLRWFHTLSSPWFVMGLGQLQRSTVDIDPYPTLDYMLWHAGLGLGVEQRWSPASRSRVALGHNRVWVDILQYDLWVRAQATSLLLENQLQLSPRVSLSNTYYLYLWTDGSSGTDSRVDLSYALTRSLSIGLRHEYRRNAINVDIAPYSKVSLTTRLNF